MIKALYLMPGLYCSPDHKNWSQLGGPYFLDLPSSPSENNNDEYNCDEKTNHSIQCKHMEKST